MKIFSSKLVPLLYLLLVVCFYLIFMVAPQEATQGMVHKIFYCHVSSAFNMYLGFGLSGIFAVLFLIKKEDSHYQMAMAGVEAGLLFCTMVLATGPVWARPIWGTWWTWDPRLTTTLILWLVFCAVYFFDKLSLENPKSRTVACLLILFGLLDMPLVMLAVKIWRGLHPNVLGGKNNMPPEMKLTLLVTNIVFMILFGFVYAALSRVRLLAGKKG
ncbi:cytochrome c biogenesis protein CcsA [bacterium]|nr:cytochrome c biogenesis protein CcsA [bacterium]